MKYLRYLLLGFVAVLLVGGIIAAALTIYFSQNLAGFVVAQVEARTGFQIRSAATHVEFTPRLVVEFDQAEVFDHGQSLARLKSLKLRFSYHALLNRTGLPLNRIVLDRPQFHLPATVAQPSLPQLNAAAAEFIEQSILAISHVTRRIVVIAATVLDANNQPLLNDLDIEAYQRFLLGMRWRVNFDTTWTGTPLKDTRLSGTVNLDARQSERTPVAEGEFWFWSVSLDGLPVAPGLQSRGQLQGNLGLTLHDDGTAVVDSEFKVARGGLSGQRLLAPTSPLDLTLDAVVNSTPDQLTLQKLELWQGRQILIAGEGSVAQPYSANPALKLRLGGLTLTAAQLQQIVSSIRGTPSWLQTYTASVTSGELRVNQLGLDSNLDALKSPSPRLAKHLTLDATLQSASFNLPATLKLPPVQNLQATVLIRQSLLTVSQGSANWGNSNLTSLDAQADFSRGTQSFSYRTRLGGDLDIGQLYSQSTALTDAIPASVRNQLRRLDGTVGFDLQASGKGPASGSGWTPPSDYKVTLTPRNVGVALKVGGPAFNLIDGKALLTPDLISLDRITAKPPTGKVVLNGSLKPEKAGLRIEELRASLEQLQAEQWVPLLVNPRDLSAKGAVTGTAKISSPRTRSASYQVDGNLRLVDGQIGFGFLRAPVITPLATLRLADGGARLTMPNSKLEGSKIDLTLAVADLRHPRMEIDSLAENIDLEVMTFIRMPWTPKTPAVFFDKSHAFGHFVARQSHLEHLSVRDLKLDFTRDGSEWHIYDCTGRIFNGGLTLDIFGRAPDDWVHIQSHLTDVDLGPLVNLTEPSAPQPIVGKLNANADLWADTNADFFETMAGTMRLDATHGVLRRFRLLSRVLSFIDLSRWLTARIPDPNVNGLPFDNLTATFAGKEGLFYTQDLLLTGPAMTISAVGDVNLVRSTLNMQLGLRPFSTVEKVVGAIPILGRGIADQHNSILAAYFNVRGPIRDPSVTPAPVTSIAAIIKRTLGLPINIIRPNTIK
ncbi:MAG TPA: AsmA-like C-terminal domain-containing protein [Candidatus Binataceae bacterium]|nr:AsmA-like C-terminal domain-containing protein [Candidatus Binataceae bacterium]